MYLCSFNNYYGVFVKIDWIYEDPFAEIVGFLWYCVAIASNCWKNLCFLFIYFMYIKVKMRKSPSDKFARWWYIVFQLGVQFVVRVEILDLTQLKKKKVWNLFVCNVDFYRFMLLLWFGC